MKHRKTSIYKLMMMCRGWSRVLPHASHPSSYSSNSKDPDIIILIVTPKQAMWVANSLLFATGGPRITANFAGMQASCGNATVIPVLTNSVNFSPGCYGCRSAGKLAEDEMYVGVALSRMTDVVSGIRGLRKAMRSLDRGHSG